MKNFTYKNFKKIDIKNKIYIVYIMSNIENPICQFQNCNRMANYRKLKVGNCHLKDTKYEFCGYHRPINSINK